ncbi:MAG: 2-oxo acid dehydrogenase subunit E2 [Microbacteriaceae bacterium]|nr:2-oxo acid dehydrogenase subunit E2 [Microbacteriaceae bacterium]
MLKEFRLPDLGEGLTESEIVGWRISAGDHVVLNQIIADVETAKAVVELPSPVDGVVQTLHAQPGDTVEVGETIVTFELEGDGAPAAEPAVPVAPEAAAEAAAPASGAALAPAAGAADAPAADEPPAPNLVGYGAAPERAGRPVRRARADLVAPGPVPAPVRRAPESTPDSRSAERRSTPPVRHLAETLGVDLARVTGTGADGTVTRADVLAAVDGSRSEVPAVAGRPAPGTFTTWDAGGGAVAGLAAGALGPEVTRTPIKGVRKHTAAAMVRSAFTAPHATCFLTVDVTRTVELLGRLTASRGASAPRVGMLALMARAFLVALRAHPELNSRWDDAAGEILTFGRVHLGIAAATERGLVVPHIPDAQAMTLDELAAALAELTAAARESRTPPELLTGSTITISNLGVFGVDAGTPILNPGEAAILAIGAVQRRPWEFEGELALRQVVTLSLSFDHRVIDGAEASRFLADLGALLADPGLALLR